MRCTVAVLLLVAASSVGCTSTGSSPAVSSPLGSSTPAGVSDTPSGWPVSSMAQLRTGRVQAVVRVGGAPYAPDWQAEGFGSVWVANSAKSAVQRIDPAT